MSGSASDPNKAAVRRLEMQDQALRNAEIKKMEGFDYVSPEKIAEYVAQDVSGTDFDNISEDPRFQEYFMQSLQGLKDRSVQGLTAEDKFATEELLNQVSANEMAQRRSLEQEAARQGTSDSGIAAAAQISARQNQSNNARQQAMQMAAQGMQQRMAATGQLGQTAMQGQSQLFNQQATVADRRDSARVRDALNRQDASYRNHALSQDIENERASTANLQSNLQNVINQQNNMNEFTRLGAQGQLANNMANLAANAPVKPSGFQSLVSGASTGAQVGGAVGGPAGAGYGAGIGAGVGVLSSMFADGGIVKDASTTKGDYNKQNSVSKEDKKFEKKLTQGLSLLSKAMDSKSVRNKLPISSDTRLPEAANIMSELKMPKYEDGGIYISGDEEIVDGNSYSGDRVDAKLNSGEAVLNVTQQQRLMDILSGKLPIDQLGNDDIIEGVEASYQSQLKDKIDTDALESSGFKKLLKMLGDK